MLDDFARPRSRRVVFTNGVFDLLHAGHVSCLVGAAALGDVLVVAVNTDDSVRRLGKGPGRPLMSESERALVVAALEAVDCVSLFDEDTPEELIAGLLPDVLVKGGDYRPEDVVGREVVEGAGGSVEILPFVAGQSTSDLIRRIGEMDP